MSPIACPLPAPLSVSVSSAIIKTTTAPSKDDVAIAAAGQFDVLRNQIDPALDTTFAPTKSKVVS